MTQDPRGVDVTTREQQLAQTFVTLADTLVEDYDVVELLDELVAACVRLLGVSAAGLLLDDQIGHLAVVASSSEETRLLEIFQLQNDEGPCLECYRTREVVASGHLDDERERWPMFAAAAVMAGFHSVAAIPLRLRSQSIGTLNLFGAGAEPITGDDQRLAQALADVATIGILQERTLHDSQVVGAQLQHALNSRVIIEQAKGMLAERNATDLAAAFGALRSYARTNNLKVTDVASRLVAGTLHLDLLGASAAGDGQPAP
jgi:transcriptional regulator with GAF, ATPase, and Fis domain